jgi:hypothetical protein
MKQSDLFLLGQQSIFFGTFVCVSATSLTNQNLTNLLPLDPRTFDLIRLQVWVGQPKSCAISPSRRDAANT